MAEKTTRRRWGWRLFLLFDGLVLGAIIAYGLWFYFSSRGVRTRVEKLQQAGEPILPADFVGADLDDPQNAAGDIIEIAKIIDSNGALKKLIGDFGPAIPLTGEERINISTAMQVMGRPLEQLERARAKPRCDWPLDLSQPILGQNFSTEFSGLRSITTLVGAAATLDHELGKDDQAIAHLSCGLFLSRCADRHPTLVGHLIGIGCAALISDRLIDLAPDLRTGTGSGEASPADVRRLIDELLDEKQQVEALKWCLRGERMSQLDTMRATMNGITVNQTTGTPARRKTAWMFLVRPYFNHNASVLLDRMTTMIESSDQPNLPAALKSVPKTPQQKSRLTLLADLLLPSLERSTEVHYRCLTDRRLAAIALAIRWYACEHGGELPADLAALTPKYLPAIPSDPLTPDSRPLTYLPTTDNSIIYSLGTNNLDDGGSEQAINPLLRLPDEWDRRDRVVHLKRQPRKPSWEEQMKQREAEEK
jgi:hypothetical protein